MRRLFEGMNKAVSWGELYWRAHLGLHGFPEKMHRSTISSTVKVWAGPIESGGGFISVVRFDAGFDWPSTLARTCTIGPSWRRSIPKPPRSPVPCPSRGRIRPEELSVHWSRQNLVGGPEVARALLPLLSARHGAILRWW